MIIVSDHALVRYMERVMGLDLASLRRRLADEVRPFAEAGAASCVIGRANFCFLVRTDGHIAVATVITDKMRAQKTRRRSRRSRA